jgi:HEAT repeat protein
MLAVGARMKRRLSILIGFLILAGLCAFYLLPAINYPVVGWWKGEAFFEGRPTSFWAAAFKQDPSVGAQGDVGKKLREGGTAAVPVLCELAKWGPPKDQDKLENRIVRSQALLALSLIDWDPRTVPFSTLHKLTTDFDIVRGVTNLSPSNRRALEELIFKIVNEDPDPQKRAEAALCLARLGAPKAAEALAMTLEQADQKTRLKVAVNLWQLKHDARMVLPVAEAGLRSEDHKIRDQALLILGQIGRKDKNAVLVNLLEMVRHQDPGTRKTAIHWLSQLAPDPAAKQAFVDALNDNDKDVRMSGVRALSFISYIRSDPAAMQALGGALTDENQEVRRYAAHELAGRGYKEQVLPILVEELAYSKYKTGTIGLLARVGKGNDQVMRALLDILQSDQDSPTRRSAAAGLATVAPQSKKVINALIEVALNGRNSEERVSALEALEKIGPTAKSAKPMLVSKLKDDRAVTVRMAAIRALVAIDNGPEIVPILVAVLRDDSNFAVRSAAAEALGSIGGRALPAAVALKKALADENSFVRVVAAEALFKIDPHDGQGIKVLIELVRANEVQASSAAAQALGGIGPAAKAAVPALIDMVMADEQEWERRSGALAAILALGRMGPAAKESVPMMIELLKKNDSLRSACVGALREFGPDAKSAIPVLAQELKSSDFLRRVDAATALCKIDGRCELYIPIAVEGLKDQDPGMRSSAASALGKIGPPAATAVRSLREALNDEQPVVRWAAQQALRQIDPKSGEEREIDSPPFP